MGYIGAGPTRFNTADELTVTGDAEFNGDLTVKGTHITLDSATVQTVDLGDNDKIRLGDGDDLQIYHDGSNSYIIDDGTGSLILRGSSQIKIQSLLGEDCAIFNENGSSSLQYDNATKLATTATGVDVTGGLTTTGNVGIGTSSTNYGKFTVQNTAGTGKVLLDTYQAVPTTENVMAIYADASNGYIDSYNNGYKNIIIAGSGGNVGIGMTTPVANLEIKKTVSTTGNMTDTALHLTTDGTTGRKLNIGFGLGGGVANTNAAVIGFDVTSGSGATQGDLFFSTRSGTSDSVPTERMRIDSSGNVGIGITTPDAEPRLHLRRGDAGGVDSATNSVLTLENNTTAVLQFLTPNTAAQQIRFGDPQDTGAGFIQYNHSINAIQFGTNGPEKMRIDSSGNLFVTNDSNVSDNNNANLCVNHSASTRGINLHTTGTGGSDRITFQNDNGTVGTINTSGSSTSYGTSSDYRLKTAVEYDWDATARLKQLRPARFEWIADGDDAVPVDGFLAHEVEGIVPEAITGTHNGMRDEEYQVSAATGDIYTPAIEAVFDEDGNEVTPAVAEVIHSTDVERPEELAEGQQWRETTEAVMGTRSVPDYQGIDQSKLVPLLVKTIQELEARIVALETA